MGRMMTGTMLTVTTNPTISFTIDGDRFSTGAGGGSVQLDGAVVLFSGDDMDGWQGTMSPSGVIMYFRSDPTKRHPGGGASNGETKCDRR
ncbi:MAG: hypothetical protein IT380_12340 [Myxococcales bacterium]|nr:hypothetical protein [Myxococcales bacterium]